MITAKSFNIVADDGGGESPYKIQKKEIIVFFRGLSSKGIITSNVKDTLKINWEDNDFVTHYFGLENTVVWLKVLNNK